jgi:endonuclease/exonuclease/phosphatase family metal-dependent hydrolase
MLKLRVRFSGLLAALILAAVFAGSLRAQTRVVRVATYNIEADINGATAALPGLIAPPGNVTDFQAGGVLAGIGEELLNGNAQPIDVLALQETTSNTQTVAPIASALNTFYGVAGMYSNSSYQATESGGVATSGNGPNAVVFNTRTVQLVASVPVDPAGGPNQLGSSSGEYREVMRYKFAPAGVPVTASNVFYVYVSHYKSGTGSSNIAYRNGEAQIIRTNEALDLPANARVIYVGDYNVTASSEAGYQAMLAATAPNGVAQGAGIDPMNTNDNQSVNWGAATTATNLLAMETEHSYDLEYRDDLQVMTTNVYYGAPGGFSYVPGTYHVFGNNGTIAYYGSVNSGGNTALAGRLVTNGPVFIPAAQLFLDLTNASDHLPVVADYTVPLPAPAISGASLDGSKLVVALANCATNGGLTLLMGPSLGTPLSNWTTIATATATNGSVTITATNVWNATNRAGFFILREK